MISDNCVRMAVSAVKERFPELDGAMGLAITLVVLRHYGANLIEEPTRTGNLETWQTIVHHSTWMFGHGVALFFVLSGFLITRILLDNWPGRGNLKVFFIRRAFRILPMAVGFIAAMFLLKWSMAPGWLWDWMFLNQAPGWSYFVFLQNFFMGMKGSLGGNSMGGTWSLAIEEQFYGLMPCLVFFFREKLLPWACLCALPLAYLLKMHFHDMRSYVWMPCRLDPLLAGAFAACLYRNSQSRSFLSESQWGILLLWGSLAGGLLFMNRMPQYFGYTIYPIFAAFWFVTLLTLTHHRETLLARFFRNPVLKWIGTISFSLYLFHQPVLGLCFKVFRDKPPSLSKIEDLTIVGVAIAICTAASTLSHKLIEKPCILLGHRFHYSITDRN